MMESRIDAFIARHLYFNQSGVICFVVFDFTQRRENCIIRHLILHKKKTFES